MPIQLRKLPQSPKDGDAVVDSFGNIWQFDASQGSWIDKGTIIIPGPVTEATDGIVTPEIFRKLAYLRTVYDQNPDNFISFKIKPGLDAYWYYFHSGNKLFRFIPEGSSRLRIEVDRGRLYQILMKQSCPGTKGPAGDPGPVGQQGVSGALEIAYTPTSSSDVGDRLDFAIFTPTPISTDISLRLYQVSANTASNPIVPIPLKLHGTKPINMPTDQLKYWSKYLKDNEFTNPDGIIEQQLIVAKRIYSGVMLKQSVGCNIALSPPLSIGITNDPIIEIHINPQTQNITIVNAGTNAIVLDQIKTQTSISYDAGTSVLCGSIYLAETTWGNIDNWALRSRQIGPKGDTGPVGECKVSVIECDISDTDVVLATCPIISLRADCDAEIVYLVCSQILPEICVTQLQLTTASASVSDQSALSATFGALQATIADCKPVYTYKAQLPQGPPVDLDLLHWEPQAGCISHSVYDTANFDWIPYTDLPACNNIVTWYGPDGPRSVKFPWAVVTQTDPGQDYCCADQYFYCTNVQTTEVTSPAQSTPIPPPLCIEEYDSNGNLIDSIKLTQVTSSYLYPIGNAVAHSVAGSIVWRGCGMHWFLGAKSASTVLSGITCSTRDLVYVPVVYELFCYDTTAKSVMTTATTGVVPGSANPSAAASDLPITKFPVATSSADLKPVNYDIVSCVPCDLPPGDMTLTWTREDNTEQIIILAYDGIGQWKSGCIPYAYNSAEFTITCQGSLIDFTVKKHNSADCSGDATITYSNQYSDPISIVAGNYNCNPFSLSYNLPQESWSFVITSSSPGAIDSLDKLSLSAYAKLTLFVSFPVCPTGDRSVASADGIGMGQHTDWDCSTFRPPVSGEPIKPWVKTLVFTDSRACGEDLVTNPTGVQFDSAFLFDPYIRISKIRLTDNVNCGLAMLPPSIDDLESVPPVVYNTCGPSLNPDYAGMPEIFWCVVDQWGEVLMEWTGQGNWNGCRILGASSGQLAPQSLRSDELALKSQILPQSLGYTAVSGNFGWYSNVSATGNFISGSTYTAGGNLIFNLVYGATTPAGSGTMRATGTLYGVHDVQSGDYLLPSGGTSVSLSMAFISGPHSGLAWGNLNCDNYKVVIVNSTSAELIIGAPRVTCSNHPRGPMMFTAILNGTYSPAPVLPQPPPPSPLLPCLYPSNATAPKLIVYSTGVDNNLALVPDGSRDPHYIITASADSKITINDPAWVCSALSNGAYCGNSGADGAYYTSPLARCIGVKARGTEARNGEYDFTTWFNTEGFDPTSINLQCTCIADDAINSCTINDNVIPNSALGDTSKDYHDLIWHLPGTGWGVVDGANKLTFKVQNIHSVLVWFAASINITASIYNWTKIWNSFGGFLTTNNYLPTAGDGHVINDFDYGRVFDYARAVWLPLYQGNNRVAFVAGGFPDWLWDWLVIDFTTRCPVPPPLIPTPPSKPACEYMENPSVCYIWDCLAGNGLGAFRRIVTVCANQTPLSQTASAADTRWATVNGQIAPQADGYFYVNVSVPHVAISMTGTPPNASGILGLGVGTGVDTITLKGYKVASDVSWVAPKDQSGAALGNGLVPTWASTWGWAASAPLLSASKVQSVSPIMLLLSQFHNIKWNLNAGKHQAMVYDTAGYFFAQDLVGPDPNGYLYAVCYVLELITPANPSLRLTRYFYEKYNGVISSPIWNANQDGCDNWVFDPTTPTACVCGAVDQSTIKWANGILTADTDIEFTLAFVPHRTTVGNDGFIDPSAAGSPLVGGYDFTAPNAQFKLYETSCFVNMPYVTYNPSTTDGNVYLTLTGVAPSATVQKLYVPNRDRGLSL